MRKKVFFTDFHAHIYEDFSKPDPEYGTDRFRIQVESLQRVYDIARENNADLLFGGDLFHKRAKLDDIVFNHIFRTIADNSDVPTILVRGNHDSRTNATVTQHWLEPFKFLKHVTVIDVPNATITSDGCAIFGIPYSDDTVFLKNKLAEFAKTAKSSQYPSILIAHVGVDGSETGRYSHRLEGAFSIGDLYPDAFNYVCLGHYHKRQSLGGLDNMFYGGNTIQTSFADEGQDKGVFLIDLDKGGKPEFIPIHNKKFITLTEVNEQTQNIVDNNYVRFILPPEQAKEIEVFKEDNDNIRLEIQREYKTETRIDISMHSTEEDIVTSYTKEFYPEATDLALDILKEVRQNA